MPNINTFTYNGTASNTYGLFVTGKGTYDAAEFDVTKYEIPGRNGDLIIPNNRYRNITITYPVFIPKAFKTQVQSIRNWLRSAKNYVKLSDTYDTTHFRLAMATGIQVFEPVNQNNAANFEVTFDCKPQRFLNDGDTESSVTSGNVKSNSTQYDALPLFTFSNPTGTSAYLQVSNTKGTFKLSATGSFTGSITVDCETQNIYSGSNNKNSLFTGSFPILAPGNNTITFSGISNVKIKTRLWEL